MKRNDTIFIVSFVWRLWERLIIGLLPDSPTLKFLVSGVFFHVFYFQTFLKFSMRIVFSLYTYFYRFINFNYEKKNKFSFQITSLIKRHFSDFEFHWKYSLVLKISNTIQYKILENLLIGFLFICFYYRVNQNWNCN